MRWALTDLVGDKFSLDGDKFLAYHFNDLQLDRFTTFELLQDPGQLCQLGRQSTFPQAAL